MKPKTPIPDRIAKLMSPKDRKEYGVLSLQERREKQTVKDEKELLKLVSNWLYHHGYSRRSPMDITYILPERGWQIHLHHTKRNPTLLDILLLRNDERYFEFELKIPGGKWSSVEQGILCTHHGKPVFTTLEEVIVAVEEWEKT